MSLTMDGVQLTSFKKTITMSNYHAIINMLNHTDAFMLGNKWQIEELKHSHIHSMRIRNCDIQKYFVIIRRNREVLSEAGKVFLEIIHEILCGYVDIPKMHNRLAGYWYYTKFAERITIIV